MNLIISLYKSRSSQSVQLFSLDHLHAKWNRVQHSIRNWSNERFPFDRRFGHRWCPSGWPDIRRSRWGARSCLRCRPFWRHFGHVLSLHFSPRCGPHVPKYDRSGFGRRTRLLFLAQQVSRFVVISIPIQIINHSNSTNSLPETSTTRKMEAKSFSVALTQLTTKEKFPTSLLHVKLTGNSLSIGRSSVFCHRLF